ncbi:serine/threonine protein kinase [Streptomyces sp. NPDC018031]|uniref:serine/threonine protein kinase n=1 Tax=Streptomyces sp. NPDC018031 TaxID=3365033 RepID=UPI0037B45CE5
MVGGLGGCHDPWDAEPIAFGPYRVIRRLGAGGMGEVYLARSPGGRLVAVKTLAVDGPAGGEGRRRFAREVALARRIGAAHTAVVIDAAPDADVPWMATRYIPAPSLGELVRFCGPLPADAVRWVAAGAAEALAALHTAGIVHRDLKPSNILLPTDGPRLIDFGISHAADITRTTVTLGTVAFAAPEQARGERSSPAADVYALGATLFHLAVGRPPYAEGDPFQLLARVSRAELDTTGLPAELTGVVLPCLRPDPRERPAAGQLVEAVRADLAARPRAADAGDWLPESWLRHIRGYRAPAEDATDEAGPPPAPAPGAEDVTARVPAPAPTLRYGSLGPGQGHGVPGGPARAADRTPEPGRDPDPDRAPDAGRDPDPDPDREPRSGPGTAGGTPPRRVRAAALAALGMVVIAVLALAFTSGLWNSPEGEGGALAAESPTSTSPAPDTTSPSPTPEAGHAAAAAFMDSVSEGDCLNLRYTDTEFTPDGLPEREPCDSPRAATRITRIVRLDPRTMRPDRKCPGGADAARWSPYRLDRDFDDRALCVNRVFRVGDCFPVRDWVGGRRDEGLGVSVGRTRTGHTFAKWDCDWTVSNNYEHVARVTAVHRAAAGRGVCGGQDAWLVDRNTTLVCTRVISS